MKSLKTIKNQECGALMVEYALTVCFLALVAVGSAKHMGAKINNIFEQGGGSISTMNGDGIVIHGVFAPTPTPTPSDH